MRILPFYGWLGLLVMVVSQIGVLMRIEPFYHWHTPIAWTGFILLADATVWKRRGNSWLNDNRAELFFVERAHVQKNYEEEAAHRSEQCADGTGERAR